MGWQAFYPILRREFIARMRRPSTPLAFLFCSITPVLVAGSGLLWLSRTLGGAALLDPRLAGRELLGEAFATQLILAWLAGPAVASEGLALQREEGTYELLSLAPIPRGVTLLGELLASFFFLGFLGLTTLPLAAAGYQVGAIDLPMIPKVYARLLASNLAMSAIGTLWSSLLKGTVGPRLLSYLTVFALLGGMIWWKEGLGSLLIPWEGSYP